MAYENKNKDCGAIWVLTAKNGKKYLSMTIEVDGIKHQFVAFNNHKSKDTHPDYRVFPSETKAKNFKKKKYEEENDSLNDVIDTNEAFPF